MRPVPVQISEIFGLVSLNGVVLNFYLMHLRIAMGVRMKGVRISEGPLYLEAQVVQFAVDNKKY